MKLKRYKNNPILVASRKNKWEAGAVFNPGVVHDKNTFHMIYRAVASGFSRLPKNGYANFISSIGYAKSNNGISFKRRLKPLIKPEYKWEIYGCEDPRITKFGDRYYIFYTALSEPAYPGKEGVRIALATTKDFTKVEKHGVIGPDIKSKAAVLFPEKINGKIGMLFTSCSDTPLSSIAYAEFEDINQLLKSKWPKFECGKNAILCSSKGSLRGPEVGAPPIKTSEGWLMIYSKSTRKKKWCANAALLSLKNPRKIIARSETPILEPEEKYEVRGLTPQVTFPTGAVVLKNKLYVYYGGGDKTCCLARCELKKLLESLVC